LEEKTFMGSYFWWGKMTLVGLLSLFFFILGIETLIGAFHLKNPLEFIMLFFSAGFMILVSLVGILYPAFQVHTHLKKGKVNHDEK
jgi:zinc transporter ZupT